MIGVNISAKSTGLTGRVSNFAEEKIPWLPWNVGFATHIGSGVVCLDARFSYHLVLLALFDNK
jgi:hypothetical protein